MTPNIDDLLPTAKEIQKQAAIKEAEKADEHVRRMAAAEAEKRALIEKLSKPSGLSEEEKVKLASTVIQRAVRNGLTEVQVYRFPNTLCTDRGRAIKHLKPRGYRIKYQIIEFPDGMPGDIGIVLAWGD